jgi:hypothetical protein
MLVDLLRQGMLWSDQDVFEKTWLRWRDVCKPAIAIPNELDGSLQILIDRSLW